MTYGAYGGFSLNQVVFNIMPSYNFAFNYENDCEVIVVIDYLAMIMDTIILILN